MTIPSPSMLHYRGGRKMIDKMAYPTMEQFYSDLGQAYKQVVGQFYAAGCRYLQLDDCSFARYSGVCATPSISRCSGSGWMRSSGAMISSLSNCALSSGYLLIGNGCPAGKAM